MTTKEQGICGEAKVLAKFIELGIPVSIPFGDNCSYDLVAEFNGKLQKTQVKSSSQTDSNCTKFRMRKVRINRNKNVIKHYTTDEVDYYALYSTVRDKVYLVKSDEHTDSLNVRFGSTKNAQSKNVTFEDDCLIESVITN